MTRIRYLTILLLTLVSIGSWGQEGFDPSLPPEPGNPQLRLELLAEPAEAGYVSGSGRYAEGTMVAVQANAYSGYTFERWTDKQGITVSRNASFVFTKGADVETLTAHFTANFTPDVPREPDAPTQDPTQYYQLSLVASEGGSVSGGGRYVAGAEIQLSAYTNNGYEFIGWYKDNATLVSSEPTFTFTMPESEQVLNALFQFNPSKPTEPEATVQKYAIMAIATDGGTTNFSLTRETPGTEIWLYATPNSGYRFDGWFLNDNLYSEERGFYYTVTQNEAVFEARFTFDPAMPTDPVTPENKKFSLYLMNCVTKPSTEVKFTVYLSALEDLTDITFQINFAPELKPFMDRLTYSEKVSEYVVSCQATEDDTYVFSFANGTLPPCDIPLLTFTIPIPEDITTAKGYQVKINQTSIGQSNGKTFGSSTRNGRISVYKNGDANGDDVVSIIDAVLVVDCILGHPSEDFIEEAANVNDDEGISIIDAVGVVDIILGENNESGPQQSTNNVTPD